MLDSSFTTTERQILVDVFESSAKANSGERVDDCERRDERASIPYGGSPAWVSVLAQRTSEVPPKPVAKGAQHWGPVSGLAWGHRQHDAH